MRFAFVAVMVVHGLIHLLGFVKAFGLAEVSQLSGATIVELGPAWVRPLGVLWLVAAVLIVAAMLMFVVGAPAWWQLGAIGLVLSQALIVLMWRDARAGTIANLVLAIAVAMAWGQARFDRATDDAIAGLLARTPAADAPARAVVTEAEVAALPAPVARWLRRAGVIGRPRVATVWLRQRGRLRTAADKPFLAARAEQTFAVDPPGFVWAVRTRMKGLPIVGRDSYLDGRGRMLITASGLVPIVDATGPAIDQGALVRFLGEMIWFPSAALAPYVTWRAIDDRTAEATMSHRGVTASARFTIDDDGRPTAFAARRYLGSGADARLEDWYVPLSAWDRFDGVEVATRGNVIWKLAAGDFDYYQWELTALAHDPAPPTR